MQDEKRLIKQRHAASASIMQASFVVDISVLILHFNLMSMKGFSEFVPDNLLAYYFGYIILGRLYCSFKKIIPPFSQPIKQGDKHFSWGLLHYYWMIWWPYYLVRKETKETN